MPIYAETLLKEAKDGKVCDAQERRHVIGWLLAEENPYTNAELAHIFQVAERTISLDRSKIREDMATSIKEEDVALILADMKMSHDREARDIQKSKQKCKLGTKTYLDHCVASMKLRTDFMKSFQDLGVYPKNLGVMHVEKFEFVAHSGLTPGSDARTVTQFDDKQIPTIEAQVVEMKALPNAENRATTTEPAQSVNAVTNSVEQAGKPAPATGAFIPAVQADECVGSSLPPAGSTV